MNHLGRTLGLVEALAIGIGSMIGAGIFVLSGIVAQRAGPAAVLSFVLSGMAVLLTALSFAELATAMPKAGGPYVYVKRAFGDFWGFFVGWSLWVGLALATVFYATGFAQYLSVLLKGPGLKGMSLMVGGALLLVNLRGSGSSGSLQNAVVFLLLLILGGYIYGGWSRMDPALHSPFLPYGWEPVVDMAAVVFVSFLGFELVATAAEEMKNPKRDLPLATIGSVIAVVAIYVLVMYVATGIMPHFDLGETPTPIADTASWIFGPFGKGIIVVAGLLATLSSANTSIMASSRIGWAMAKDALLPEALSRVHPKWQSPYVAVGATGMLFFLAFLVQDVERLAGAAGFLHLYPFFIVNLALLKLRRSTAFEPSFRVPGGPVPPLTACVAMLLLLSKVNPVDILWSAYLVIPGLLYRFVLSRPDLLRWAGISTRP